ncbi:glycosyl transferase [Algimonas arctica]|uniref:Glycosyl transferase n=1 Tax=Algimonas arctica TaxID=1479486 RepID=A0A8J3G2W5_9PROT|nr:glycosyl transferase [Algimonas arctica]
MRGVLTVIIPTFQAEQALMRVLPQLLGQRVIVSDGGSTDDTLTCAVRAGAVLAVGVRGRGAQLKLGAKLAALSGGTGDWYLFLHADSQLPDGWRDVVHDAMQQDAPRYFRFKADASGLKSLFMNRMVALRCWALGLPYGDQGLLISRALYERVGGHAKMALFEDVELIERLKKVATVRPLPLALTTDVSKHWQDGLWRRGLRNLGLLWRYKHGATVSELLKAYTK